MLWHSPLTREDCNHDSNLGQPELLGKNNMPMQTSIQAFTSFRWRALGPFGGLLGLSSKEISPNIERRFNAQFGNIEYVAKRKIKPNEELVVFIGEPPKGRSRSKGRNKKSAEASNSKKDAAVSKDGSAAVKSMTQKPQPSQ